MVCARTTAAHHRLCAVVSNAIEVWASQAGRQGFDAGRDSGCYAQPPAAVLTSLTHRRRQFHSFQLPSAMLKTRVCTYARFRTMPLPNMMRVLPSAHIPFWLSAQAVRCAHVRALHNASVSGAYVAMRRGVWNNILLLRRQGGQGV